MQSRNVFLPVLLGIMVVGLFGIQDAYAVLPSPPLHPDAQEKSSDRIDFTWTEPAAGAPILSYNIYVESPNGTPFVTIPVPSTGGIQTYQHTGLTPETPYYYEVAAVNAEGEGNKSISVSTETLPPGIMVTVIDEDTCIEIGDEFGDETIWEDPNTCRLESGSISIDLGDELIIPAGIIFVVDPGAMIISEGIIVVGGQFDNSGTVIADEIQNSGMTNNLLGGTFTSESFFNNSPGTLDNDGIFNANDELMNSLGASISNSGDFNNNSIITSFGSITNTGSNFINDGEIASSGSFTNTGNSFTNNNLLTITGTFENSGSGVLNNNSNLIIISPLLQVTNSATINNLSGTIKITSSGGIDNTSGVIDNSSIILNECGSITGNLITGDNQPVDGCLPSIAIEDPDTFTFTNEDSIVFLASGTDIDNYGNSNPNILDNVTWTHTLDSIQTIFGTGATTTTTLNPGTYLIIANVTDGTNFAISQITLEISGFDADGDGYPAPAPGIPDNIADCNDIPGVGFDINPGATEIVADGVDQNCDTQELCHADSDMDAYGDVLLTILSDNLDCTETLLGESDNALDCNDTNLNINPGATEIVADGVDQNCDTQELCYVDSDMDTYGNEDLSTIVSLDLFCDAPLETKANDALDCDDTNFDVNPGIEEVFNNGLDDNCSGEEDEGFVDNDEDGYPFPADCDDDNTTVYPGAPELDDNKDNDCNGLVDDQLDLDGDGYFTGSDEDPTTDCNDDPSVIPGTDPPLTGFDINPGATEVEDGVDNNCDELIDNIEQKLVSPEYQEDLSRKQIKFFDKLVDRWEHQIGQLENNSTPSNDALIEILQDKISVVQISLGNLPVEDVVVDTYEDLSAGAYYDIQKEITDWEKLVDRLTAKAEKYDDRAQKYEDRNKLDKAEKLRDKADTIYAQIAVIEDIIEVLKCAIDFTPDVSTGVLDIPITASSDDAEEDKSKMDLDSNDLDLNEKKYVGLRFQNLAIPAGSTITNAYVQFTTQDDKDTGRAKVSIFAQDTDNAQTFTKSKNNISSRDATSASIDWSIPDWKGAGSSGSKQQTPDISPLIQEVVDRNGWTSGNSAVIIIKEYYGYDRDAISYDANPNKAAVLHVEFTTDGSPSTNFVVNGNFETPTVSDHDGNWELFLDGTSGLAWTVTDGPLELQRGILGGSFEGQQHAELDSTNSITISQSLNTVSGDTYDLSFAYKARPNTDAATNGLQVTWNGVDVAPGITLTDSWQTMTIQVTGVGNDVLAFSDIGDSDSYGTFLDDVVVITSN